jgi:predicted O-linked N-acetylglucosamine transferase (SPINDLY family)
MTALQQAIDAAGAHYASARFDEAAAAYRRALALAPGNAALLHNLGVALAAGGRADEAAAAITEALALAPQSQASWLALGHLEFGRDRLEAAQAAFAAAARIAPRSVEAQYNLGYTLHERWHFADAVPPLAAARGLAPSDEQVWYQLYNTRLAAGDREGALTDFLAFERDAAPTAVFLRAALECVRALGDAARETRVVGQVLAHPFDENDLGALAGFLMRLQYFDVPRAELKRLYDTYDRLMRARVRGAAPLASASRRPGCLRVGYLSADWRGHVMGRLMHDVIGAHDRDRYAIHLYSLASPAAADAMTDRFRALAERYVELPARRDLDAARAIAADDCDVLVDLMGHTMFSRPEILAYKPARRIVTHLGSHGALGLSQVDFKLTDLEADIADAGDFQIERPLPMACCVLPFRRAQRGTAPAPTRGAAGIAPDALVLGEFVTVQKLSPRCLGLWRAILERVPDAVLLFSPSAEGEHAAFRRQLAGFGIDPARAAFVARGRDEAEAAARYALVDLVLDTLPYTGGDTTLAALDAGVPVVTLAGTRHAERMGASILRHAGLPELVTASEADYVDLAVALATDHDRRARMAATVCERFTAVAATYPTRYTRDLEAALEAAMTSPSATVPSA